MDTRKTRPSRLLNLNHSPKEQKTIATINATESPLLRLPPELRCRIYDHLFASIAVHIRPGKRYCDGSEDRYKLSLCEAPNDHKHTPLRYVEHRIDWRRKVLPGCTIDQTEKNPFTPQQIGLGLLSTCRQLYHEAVLKPFTQISFSVLGRCLQKHSGLPRFVDSLIPTQAKAIANLRITLDNALSRRTDPGYPSMLMGPVPAKTTIAKLKGLTNMEIVLAPFIEEEPEVKASMFISELEEAFIMTLGMQALVHSRLRSLRVTMDATFVDFEDELTPTFAERGEKEVLEIWLRETEMRLHFGSVLSDDAPLPEFGIVQNDENVCLPPWATLEGLEKTRLEEEKEAEEMRLKREAILERRRILYGEDYGR